MRRSASSSSASTAASSASIAPIRSPAAVDAARRAATSGPSGDAPPRIASPTCLLAALRSALSPSPSDSSARRRSSSASATSTTAGSSPLSIAPWRITLRLFAQALHPDAHPCSPDATAAPPPPREAIDHEAAVKASQEPARAWAVRRARGTSRTARRTPGRRGRSSALAVVEDRAPARRCPTPARRRHARRSASAPRNAALGLVERAGLGGQPVGPHGDPRLLGRVRVEPAPGGRRPARRAGPASRGVSGAALLGRGGRGDVDRRLLDEERDVGERQPERGRLGGDVRRIRSPGPRTRTAAPARAAACP